MLLVITFIDLTTLLGTGSKELVYQQVLRRFAHFNVMRLSTPAPLMELLMLALDEEERMGRWSECDGPKDQIAQVMAVVSPLCHSNCLKTLGWCLDFTQLNAKFG